MLTSQRTHMRFAVPLAAALLASASVFATASQPDGTTQRVQGTIHVDAGRGLVEMTSRATTLPADLGQQTSARLQSTEGRVALQQGNARAQAATGKGVGAADVQAIADRYAGKTVYESSLRRLPGITPYVLTLDARAPGGARVVLSMQVDSKTLAPRQPSVAYYPDGKDPFNSFATGKHHSATVHIDKIEQVGDKVYAISGRFSAADLMPTALSKKLKDQTLSAVSGRFAFTEVPLRDK